MFLSPILSFLCTPTSAADAVAVIPNIMKKLIIKIIVIANGLSIYL